MTEQRVDREELRRAERERGLQAALADRDTEIARLRDAVLCWLAAGIISEGKASEVMGCDHIATRLRLAEWRDRNPEAAAAAEARRSNDSRTIASLLLGCWMTPATREETSDADR